MLSHFQDSGTVSLVFKHTVKDAALQLGSAAYTNAFGEVYTITKFKYYVSNIGFSNGQNKIGESDSYHLVDVANEASQTINVKMPVGNYQSLHFVLGVDSLHNVSGAQTGALDPLNDMFWTWNSGYVMAKLEGASPASTAINNRIEYHIGGYSSSHNVIKEILFKWKESGPLNIYKGKTTEIVIEADIDTWWQGSHDLMFSKNPVCTGPGELAGKFAENYSRMFRIKNITNY